MNEDCLCLSIEVKLDASYGADHPADAIQQVAGCCGEKGGDILAVLARWLWRHLTGSESSCACCLTDMRRFETRRCSCWLASATPIPASGSRQQQEELLGACLTSSGATHVMFLTVQHDCPHKKLHCSHMHVSSRTLILCPSACMIWRINTRFPGGATYHPFAATTA